VVTRVIEWNEQAQSWKFIGPATSNP
jgi:hypothetical protein